MYNQARGVFLSSKVSVADSANEPLKMLSVLVGGLGLDAVSGLWLSPLYASPVVPRLFPFDLIYLDRDNQILDAEEIVPGVEFPPFRQEVTSALLLAHHTLQSTQTTRGDRLIICPEVEVDLEIAASNRGFPSVGPRESMSAGKGEAARPEPESSRHAAHVLSAVNEMRENAVLATSFELPVPAAVPEVAAVSPTNDVKDLTVADTPVISITEVVLERSPSPEKIVVNGHHGGVEDLFSIWVDSPSPASARLARYGAPDVKRSMPPPAILPLSAVPETASESKPSSAVVSRSALEAVKARQQGIGEATPAPREEKPKLPTKRDDFGVSARTVQPTLATAFTVGQYGLWQVSTPASASQVAALRGPLAVQLAVSASDASSKTGKTEAHPNERAMAKAPESKKLAGDSGTSASVPLFSGVAKSMQKVPSPPESAVAGGVPMPAAADVKPLVNMIKNAMEQVQDSVIMSAGQPQTAKSTVALPTEVEKPKVLRADASTAEIMEAIRKKVVVEPKATGAPKALMPAKSAPSKQSGEKKKYASGPSAEHSLLQPSPNSGNGDQNGKPKTSTQQEANGKAKEQQLSLGTRFKRWLNPATPTISDRRKAYRRYVPGMVAHYYTGGAPKPHDVADISMTGIYLLTDDRWMPETMIQMTLQKPCAKGERKQSIAVLAKIVRRGSDGVAAQFVMPESLDPHSHDVQPSQATDRFSLARFI